MLAQQVVLQGALHASPLRFTLSNEWVSKSSSNARVQHAFEVLHQ